MVSGVVFDDVFVRSGQEQLRNLIEIQRQSNVNYVRLRGGAASRGEFRRETDGVPYPSRVPNRRVSKLNREVAEAILERVQ